VGENVTEADYFRRLWSISSQSGIHRDSTAAFHSRSSVSSSHLDGRVADPGTPASFNRAIASLLTRPPGPQLHWRRQDHPPAGSRAIPVPRTRSRRPSHRGDRL